MTGPEEGLGWIAEHFRTGGRFPRPDWEAILGRVEGTVHPSGIEEALEAVAEEWLRRVAAAAGPGYRVHRSPRFHVLAPDFGGREPSLLRFLERALGRIRESLGDVLSGEHSGSHCVLLFAGAEDYYDYVDLFHDDGGEYPFTGGIFLPGPWEEIVVHAAPPEIPERTLAHELSHACVSHLALPAWVNEGVASVLERVATGSPGELPGREELADHRSHWNAGTIQQFWSGESFRRPDIGFGLSYTLAYLLVKALARDPVRFRSFLLRADPADAGEAACRERYGGSPGDLLEGILGPGDWAPRPAAWGGESAEAGAAPAGDPPPPVESPP
ncbi:MAG: hypothetical protein L6R43_17575 [Planctomycetes bacterium]|nr:hypothetical protein [Planctomycetota bacterium]